MLTGERLTVVAVVEHDPGDGVRLKIEDGRRPGTVPCGTPRP
jgi:hypothetical protein